MGKLYTGLWVVLSFWLLNSTSRQYFVSQMASGGFWRFWGSGSLTNLAQVNIKQSKNWSMIRCFDAADAAVLNQANWLVVHLACFPQNSVRPGWNAELGGSIVNIWEFVELVCGGEIDCTLFEASKDISSSLFMPQLIIGQEDLMHTRFKCMLNNSSVSLHAVVQISHPHDDMMLV